MKTAMMVQFELVVYWHQLLSCLLQLQVTFTFI